MATISELLKHPDITPAMRLRYSQALPGTTVVPFVQWANDLLEELQDRGFLSIVKRQTGAPVSNGKWITKPADLVSPISIFHPLDERFEYKFDDIEGKFKLLEIELEDESGSVSSASFDLYSVNGLNCADLLSPVYPEDSFEDYLALITSGTMAGTAYVLSGNDETEPSGGSAGTRIYFLHDLAAALDVAKCAAIRMIAPNYYVGLKYYASLNSVSAVGDEMPIPDGCELRLVPAWFRWKCERATSAISQETVYWERQVRDILDSIQAKRVGKVATPATARRLVGYETNLRNDKNQLGYSDF